MREAEAKALSYLGLAVRAGRAIIGVPLICQALKKAQNGGEKQPLIVIEAANTSENTHKRIADRTAYYKVHTVTLSLDSGALATAVGKRGGTVGAVGVTDRNLAAAIAALYGISL